MDYRAFLLWRRLPHAHQPCNGVAMTDIDDLPIPAVFLAREAALLHHSRWRTRAGVFDVPFHGVRTHPSISVRPEEAYAPLLKEEMFFTAGSAARLWGMVLPDRMLEDECVDLGVWAPGRVPRGRRVRGHAYRLNTLRVTTLRGLPLARPADTWVRLGPLVGAEEQIQAVDGLLRRQRPQSSLTELRAAIHRAQGCSGVSQSRLVLHRLRAGTDSPMETWLRLQLRRGGFPEPEVNLEIRDTRTGARAFANLAWPAARVIGEYDGIVHETQQERDAIRQAWLEREGWTVVRVTPADIPDLHGLYARFSSAFTRAKRPISVISAGRVSSFPEKNRRQK